MLKSLNISNFAVIAHLSVDFHQGLNLLTGETGSGKSIIIDALGLLLGGRSTSAQIRTGEQVALVEGIFEVSGVKGESIRELLSAVGIEKGKGEELIIRREVNSSGRSRIFIDDFGVTLATLRSLQPLLVEIHGQGEQRALLSRQSQLELLDCFGGCLALREEVSEAFKRYGAAVKALRLLERELSELERAGDLLRYQLEEIETVGPRVGEDDELSAEKKLLVHAERVLQLKESAYVDLYESDESVLTRLASIRRQLEELSEIDARVCAVLETLRASMLSLTDLAEALRGYGEGLSYSPERLALVEHRWSELERLKRKYQTDLPGVLKVRDELSKRLSEMSDLSARERDLRDALSRARSDYTDAARRLTSSRRSAAQELERRVMSELGQVAMEQARFLVSIETSSPVAEVEPEELGAPENEMEERAFFKPHGADTVEFLLSANPGESPRPLARVASGGELSRLMLTLRTVGLDQEDPQQSVETIIFDEIDVGIGGRVAEAVGRRLRALSRTRQVFCVTHQAQIARFADQHYLVTKSVRGGRTMAAIKRLEREERIGELARMIGGREDLATTRATARWLLDDVEAKGWRHARAERSRKV